MAQTKVIKKYKTEENSAMASSTQNFIRIRAPSCKEPKKIDFDSDIPLGLLLFMIEAETQIPVERIKLLAGFPPKEVSRDDDTALVTALFKNGEMIIVQEGNAMVRQGTTDGKYIPPSSEKCYFARRRMPGDNSCLFHAAAYVLKDKKRDYANEMRRECVEAVAANKNFFNTEVLGQKNEDYVRWISQPSSWGGHIELIILSFMYQTEIVALDLQSSRMEIVGEGKGYSTRVFLVYTGNHYDAIASTPGAGGLERNDQVMFNSNDKRVFDQAVQFVRCESKA